VGANRPGPPRGECGSRGGAVASAAAATAGACVLARAVAAGVLGGGAVTGLLAEGVRPAALS
jgi:hypothetical protein